MKNRKKELEWRPKIEAISSPALAVSLYFQFFTLSFFTFLSTLKRFQVPSPSFKRRYLLAFWWLGFFWSHVEHVSLLKQEIGQAQQHPSLAMLRLASVLHLGSCLPEAGRCSAWPRVHVLSFLSKFQKCLFCSFFCIFFFPSLFNTKIT